ncbi:MAG: hypothetical protein U0166_21335 [Acidobacteriota bacterium]
MGRYPAVAARILVLLAFGVCAWLTSEQSLGNLGAMPEVMVPGLLLFAGLWSSFRALRVASAGLLASMVPAPIVFLACLTLAAEIFGSVPFPGPASFWIAWVPCYLLGIGALAFLVTADLRNAAPGRGSARRDLVLFASTLLLGVCAVLVVQIAERGRIERYERLRREALPRRSVAGPSCAWPGSRSRDRSPE